MDGATPNPRVTDCHAGISPPPGVYRPMAKDLPVGTPDSEVKRLLDFTTEAQPSVNRGFTSMCALPRIAFDPPAKGGHPLQ